MKRVLASWVSAYKEFEKSVDDNFKGGPGEIERGINEIRQRHAGDKDYEEAYRRWCEEMDMDEEPLEVSRPVLYVIKDSHGNQLSSPNRDDSLLWDRVESMEARGKRGLSVVVYSATSIDELDDAEFVKKIAKKLCSSAYEREMLVHDINNLRGDEWFESAKLKLDRESFARFKKICRSGNVGIVDME